MARGMAARLAQEMRTPGAASPAPGTGTAGSEPAALRLTVNIGKTELELLRTSNEVLSVPKCRTHIHKGLPREMSDLAGLIMPHLRAPRARSAYVPGVLCSQPDLADICLQIARARHQLWGCRVQPRTLLQVCKKCSIHCCCRR